jgi:hypothetical protein
LQFADFGPISNLRMMDPKARSAGVRVLVEPYSAADRRSAFVQLPGGYIGAIHATVRK